MVYLFFIFSFLYLNSKIEYRKKDPLLHLKVFGKLFWIHNLGIKFIIHGLVLFSIFFFLKLLFSLTHTHINQVGPFAFSKYLWNYHYICFLWKWKHWKAFSFFLYLNPTFRILKMKTKYEFLNQTSFLWWVPLKTGNENKRHHFFKLTK